MPDARRYVETGGTDGAIGAHRVATPRDGRHCAAAIDRPDLVRPFILWPSPAPMMVRRGSLLAWPVVRFAMNGVLRLWRHRTIGRGSGAGGGRGLARHSTIDGMGLARRSDIWACGTEQCAVAVSLMLESIMSSVFF